MKESMTNVSKAYSVKSVTTQLNMYSSEIAKFAQELKTK